MKKIYNFITCPIVLFYSNIIARVNNRNQIFKSKFPNGGINKLNEISSLEAAEYFKPFESNIMLFQRREDLWDYLLDKIKFNKNPIMKFVRLTDSKVIFSKPKISFIIKHFCCNHLYRILG